MYSIELLSIDCVKAITTLANPETVYEKAVKYMCDLFSSGTEIIIPDGEYIASLCSDNGEKKLFVLDISITNGIPLVL